MEDKVNKICKSGDKILIKFDVKIKAEDLILNYCNLKYRVITNDQVKVIQKRGSANYIICIYPTIAMTFNTGGHIVMFSYSRKGIDFKFLLIMINENRFYKPR